MKKVIKFLVSLAVLMLVLPSSLAFAKSDVESIQKNGKLVLGTSADFPPFEWIILKDGKEEVVGVDIELGQKIADELGVELEVRNVGFDTLIQSVKTGRIDMALAGISQTEERAQQVDFSVPYYEGESYILVAKDKADKVTTIQDLKDLKVGVQKGTIQETYLLNNEMDIDLTSMPKNDVLIETLKTGKLDAVVMDAVTAGEFLRMNEDTITKASETIPTDDEGYSVAVAKDNTSLLEVINKVIEEAKDNEEIKQSLEKYLDLAAEDNK
ncbi:transporter substrate-binding domain-containing protein [Dolosicoccus paucivorans]|uniref:Amino acid ABC transporter substrate-binding protein n=1 Tax=Dolosicoccus paucivorans TaxID=84521 RepID=A0A2N6SKX6_9LACT|nr:transporter substrate-binding domain-containing protein [Dolosicoccus paucivorans]PMC57158.1 amino acid ABC transporter substrate-binding protein [Dolosicoccus paucivorans]